MLINDIKDIYDALAIVLVFTTILANNSETKASAYLDEYIEMGKKARLKNQKKSITKFIYKEWAFILLVNTGLIYTLTPTAFNIIKNSRIDLMNFNISMTLFVFIYIIMLYFIVSYIVLTYKLFKYKEKIEKEIKKLE